MFVLEGRKRGGGGESWLKSDGGGVTRLFAFFGRDSSHMEVRLLSLPHLSLPFLSRTGPQPQSSSPLKL